MSTEVGKLRFAQPREHHIRSRHVNQVFRVSVMLPPRRKGEETRFPIVYAGDGNLTFDMLKGISWLLQSSQAVPRFILVGIGYPGDSPMSGALLRARDFTFPGYPRLKVAPHPLFAGVPQARKGEKDFGGGPGFLRFLSVELLPLIERRYPADSRKRTYFGHSAAGSFGLFSLFTRPSLFKNYVISSPGLAYDGISSAGVRYESYEFMRGRLDAFRASGKATKGKRLFISVGDAEELEPELSNWKLVTSFRRFVADMGPAVRGVRVESRVLPGETHATAWPMAFVHGMRAVLA